jgi:hypothetical protein
MYAEQSQVLLIKRLPEKWKSGQKTRCPVTRAYQEFTVGLYYSIEEGDVTRPDIWIGTIEISWSDEKTPTVFKPAFTVVTTWRQAQTSSVSGAPECWRAMVGSCWPLSGRILYPKTENLAKRSKTCWREQERIPTRLSTVLSIRIRSCEHFR